MKGFIFTYGLTVIGAVGGVIYPFLGLCVYICFAIVRPEHMWHWMFETGGHFSRIVGLSILVGWGLSVFGRWRFKRAAGIVFCVVGYWGWMVASAFQAIDQEKAFELIGFFAKIVLPFLIGITTIRSMTEVKALLWVILLSQGYVAFEMNLAYVGGNNQARDGFGGMDNNCLAIAMVTGVGLAFFLGMGAKQWWQKGVALGAALLMAHTILLTFSRGGMLALAVTGLMSFFLIPKTSKHYVAFFAAIALVILLAGPEVRERFMTTFDKSEEGVREESAQSRVELWNAAMDVTLKNALLGVGPDCWGEIAPEYGFKRGKEVHSLWVQNAAELGIPGVSLLFGIFALTVIKLWPVARGRLKVTDPFQQDAARMVIASLIGFMVASQFVTIKYLETPYYVVLAGAALLKLLPQSPSWMLGPKRANFGAVVRRARPVQGEQASHT
jgi:probable O-glycosylation ligase (exosortase A-associated)